mmetsp:Transcript_27351/g.50408  ORF Transcript_27351/g.50408 Transcript_27351/m.50408 type:complete len:218 (-) Transcript_27351:534-1187(-)
MSVKPYSSFTPSMIESIVPAGNLIPPLASFVREYLAYTSSTIALCLFCTSFSSSLPIILLYLALTFLSSLFRGISKNSILCSLFASSTIVSSRPFGSLTCFLLSMAYLFTISLMIKVSEVFSFGLALCFAAFGFLGEVSVSATLLFLFLLNLGVSSGSDAANSRDFLRASIFAWYRFISVSTAKMIRPNFSSSLSSSSVSSPSAPESPPDAFSCCAL